MNDLKPWYETNKNLFEVVKKTLEERLNETKLLKRKGLLVCQGYFPVICDGEFLGEAYEIEIHFPKDYPRFYTDVKICDSRLPKGPDPDWHIQTGNIACLQLVEQIWIDVGDPSNFENYLNKTVNDYFIQQTYRILKGKYLNTWDHGVNGRLEFYYRKFSMEKKEPFKVLDALNILLSKEIKGNRDCPLCMGKKIKDCHLLSFVHLKSLIRKEYLLAGKEEIFRYLGL